MPLTITTYKSAGESETRKLGEELAGGLEVGSVVSLSGELGAGKTVFIRGICNCLCPGVSISSPSFTLINTYPGRLCDIYHIDLYRLYSIGEIEELGIEELIYGDCIALIEWGEKIENLLPSDTIKVDIRIMGENTREIRVRR